MIKIIDEIKGVIAEDDAAEEQERLLLYQLIRATKPQTVVEIGTHRGLTSLYMACALYDNQKGTLHTADPFDYEQKFNLTKFAQMSDRIKYYQIQGKDLDVNNVDFLFVDGFHEEKNVLEEMEHFLPRLNQQAVVVFHDCGGDNVAVGVNAAIKKLGLETAFLPTFNTMRIYGKFKP